MASSDPLLIRAVINGLIVAISTASISTVIGAATALAVSRSRFAPRKFYRALLFMPLIAISRCPPAEAVEASGVSHGKRTRLPADRMSSAVRGNPSMT